MAKEKSAEESSRSYAGAISILLSLSSDNHS